MNKTTVQKKLRIYETLLKLSERNKAQLLAKMHQTKSEADELAKEIKQINGQIIKLNVIIDSTTKSTFISEDARLNYAIVNQNRQTLVISLRQRQAELNKVQAEYCCRLQREKHFQVVIGNKKKMIRRTIAQLAELIDQNDIEERHGRSK